MGMSHIWEHVTLWECHIYGNTSHVWGCHTHMGHVTRMGHVPHMGYVPHVGHMPQMGHVPYKENEM